MWVGRWKHVCMIVSLAYKMARKLLSVPSVLLRRETTKDAELRNENAVLHGQPVGSVRYEPADRFWFTVLSEGCPLSWSMPYDVVLTYQPGP